jgi:hypothetical protein
MLVLVLRGYRDRRRPRRRFPINDPRDIGTGDVLVADWFKIF